MSDNYEIIDQQRKYRLFVIIYLKQWDSYMDDIFIFFVIKKEWKKKKVGLLIPLLVRCFPLMSFFKQLNWMNTQ